MIDNKKIEEAANIHRFELIASMHGSTLGTPMQCFEEVVDAEADLIEDSFITDAKWAINEFLKNLWHPASEVPDKDRIYSHILYEIDGGYDLNGFNTKMIPIGENWTSFVENEHINRWLYIYDLFPKEGGEQ